MDKILHHLRNPRMMIGVSIPTNNGFPWFQSGAGFLPSTVCWPLRQSPPVLLQATHRQCPKACAHAQAHTHIDRERERHLYTPARTNSHVAYFPCKASVGPEAWSLKYRSQRVPGSPLFPVSRGSKGRTGGKAEGAEGGLLESQTPASAAPGGFLAQDSLM